MNVFRKLWQRAIAPRVEEVKFSIKGITLQPVPDGVKIEGVLEAKDRRSFSFVLTNQEFAALRDDINNFHALASSPGDVKVDHDQEEGSNVSS